MVGGFTRYRPPHHHSVGPAESVDIGLGTAHRCSNYGDEDVVFIEVQRGDYFGEDDIVRIEDDFGRS